MNIHQPWLLDGIPQEVSQVGVVFDHQHQCVLLVVLDGHRLLAFVEVQRTHAYSLWKHTIRMPRFDLLIIKDLCEQLSSSRGRKSP